VPEPGPDPFTHLTLLVDPEAGAEPVSRRLSEIEAGILQLGFQYRLEEVRSPADAGRTARAALEAGDRFLVVVAGDEVLHDVVNAMMGQEGPVAPDAVLAVLPAGPRSDFAKTFGLPEDTLAAARHLAGETVYEMDVARVSCEDRAGRPLTTWMWNLSEVGMGAAAAARAARLRPVLGRASYFAGFWMTVPAFRRSVMRVRGDRKEIEARATNVVVGNGQFQRDVKLSPRSWPGDGILDVLIFTGPRSDAFTLLPKMFYGEHVPHPNIAEYRARTVSVESDRRLPVQVDGLPFGFTPARFEIVPKAIRVKL
jgi:YegS/Rv2252/BmrU family lipid kinase